MASTAAYTGGLSATYSVAGHTNVARSYVTAFSGLDVALLIPAGGTLYVGTDFYGVVSTAGYEYNGVSQHAVIDVRVSVSPQFATGVVRLSDANVVGTEADPGFKTLPFANSFSDSYTNTLDVPAYIYLSMYASLNLANSATAVPEPNSNALFLVGLTALTAMRFGRRKKLQQT